MSQTVLIADDSPTIQNKAKGILTGEGLDVITVSNGVAAIKKLPQLKPSLVLADVSMPGRDGYEVCDFVKSSPDLRHIPVILIFSDMDPYDEGQASRVHADGKIKKMGAGKPFNPEELISTVNELLAQSGGLVVDTSIAADAAVSVAPITEPVDEEPQVRARKGLDWASLPRGVAFAEPAAEEAPAPILEEQEPPVSEPLAEVSEVPPTVFTDPTPAAAPAAKAPSVPRTQRTMIFRNPADLAEPLLSDELESSPPAAIPASPEVSEHEPISASSLQGFSLTDAATGEVRFAPPDSERGTEPAETDPQERTQETLLSASPPASIDPKLVQTIVEKVVAKMSPPALPSEALEEIARKLSGEIIADLITESS